MTMAHWIRLSLLCRCKWMRKSDLWGKQFQSNIYYYASIKGVLRISGRDVPRRTKKNEKFCHLSNKPRFLCMHKILAHAQHSCACTTLLCMHWRGQGPRPGPKKSACTRVFCMHKNLVHAQESWFVWQNFQLFLVRLGTSFPLKHNTPFMLA